MWNIVSIYVKYRFLQKNSWYLLGVLFKISDEPPCHFIGESPGLCSPYPLKTNAIAANTKQILDSTYLIRYNGMIVTVNSRKTETIGTCTKWLS